MSIVNRKGQIALTKLLRDSLGPEAGSHVDFVVNASGEGVLKPARVRLNKAATAYRTALISVSGSADKRFAPTDDFMRFVRG